MLNRSGRGSNAAVIDQLFENRSAALIELRRLTEEGNVDQKMISLRVLGQAHDDASEEVCIRAMDDENVKVRTRATLTLQHIGGAQAASIIRERLLTEENTSVLKGQLVTLGRLGTPDDIPLFRQHLDHSNLTVRAIAAGAMGMQGSNEGESVLADILDGTDSGARLQATYALGYVSTSSARARLQLIIDTPRAIWQDQAVMAMAIQNSNRLATGVSRARFFSDLTQHENRLVADFALERLAEIKGSDAELLLRDRARTADRRGILAGHHLKIREGI